MFPLRVVIIALLYIKMDVTQSRNKALFPAASRTKRGAPSAVNPVFCDSSEDADLLFEILLAGVRFEAGGEFTVKDGELASLRKTQSLEVICEDVIPRKLSDVFRLVTGLSGHRGRLHQDDFERTLLTLVFNAQQVVDSSSEEQRNFWAQSLVGLYRAIQKDLTGTK